MNIEQLEKGQKLRSQIDELNETQKQLIENYKTFADSNKENYLGVSVSFRLGESYKVVCVPLDELEKSDVFNMLNNCLMKRISGLETEFEHL